FLVRLFLLLLLIGLVLGGYLFVKVYSFEKKTILVNTPPKSSTLLSATTDLITNNNKNLRGASPERINILLLGMGGEGHKGQYLTDTIILASINPTNYETALISIPRDLYVKIPDTYAYTKINAVYTYGKRNLEKQGQPAISSIKKTVEEITGQPVDYYLTINFEGFKQVIDELGGIIIQVDQDIVDHRYPGPGTSYETFKIDKGTHLVNGDMALKYARVRHVTGGDFARLERQQEIISAAKRRALSINNFVNPIKFIGLLNVLGENIQTNIQLDEIPAFIEIFNNINTYQMNTEVLDAWSSNSLLAVSHVLLGNVNAFILVSRTGNYKEIQNLVTNIFNLEQIKKEKEKIAEEAAEIVLISENYQNEHQIKNIFKKMGYSIEVEKNNELTQSCRNEIKIFTQNNNKYYTLSDLATKFNVNIEKETNLDYQADIVLCFPAKEIKKLENQINQSSADEFEGGLILDDDGNILYNEN
ncbi:MAG: LCP family protein, partial [Candidatus Moranbacteria bacterium]|nr:LCP family protein [Candidatus Moranbacteria bacterium]